MGCARRRRRVGRATATDSRSAARQNSGTQLHQQSARRHPTRAGRRMSNVVGIDLGTTNSLVAYVEDGAPVVIRDKSGDGLVPSVVSVAEDGAVYVGREGQRRLLTDAQRAAYSVTRLLGQERG